MRPIDVQFLQSSLQDLIEVRYFDTIDSTNTEAKRMIRSGLDHPILLVADRQTAGRGRLGRSFYSPDNAGIYMTLAMPIQSGIEEITRVTAKTAVAVVQGIQDCCGLDLRIKWVNDIYYKGKKTCGILAELLQEDGVTWVVDGIGINVFQREFPEELREIAGSLGLEDADRSIIIEKVAENVHWQVTNLADHSYIIAYRNLSMVLGQEVLFGTVPDLQPGRAIEIDETGALLVETETGEVVRLSTGEISLRLKASL